MLRKTRQNQLPDDSERLSDVRQLSDGESESSILDSAAQAASAE